MLVLRFGSLFTVLAKLHKSSLRAFSIGCSAHCRAFGSSFRERLCCERVKVQFSRASAVVNSAHIRAPVRLCKHKKQTHCQRKIVVYCVVFQLGFLLLLLSLLTLNLTCKKVALLDIFVLSSNNSITMVFIAF